MATARKVSSRTGCWLAPVIAFCTSTPILADSPDCQLDPVTQEFEWSREFQGVTEPITWTIYREVQFRPARRSGMYTVTETLELKLPEFRSNFRRYLGSARLDSCELRFSARAKTLTTHGQELRLPFVVEYEVASCKNRIRMCRVNGIDFHNCEKRKRKIKKSDGAEIDVSFTIELKKPKLESVVRWEQTPYYRELKIDQARSLFEQVLDDGSSALAFITGTLGQVSISRIGEDINAFRVVGGFTGFDASSYQANASYRLSGEQACLVHAAIIRSGSIALSVR